MPEQAPLLQGGSTKSVLLILSCRALLCVERQALVRILRDGISISTGLVSVVVQELADAPARTRNPLDAGPVLETRRIPFNHVPNLASLPCVVRKRKRLLSLSIFFRSAVDSVLYCRHWAKGEGMDASGQRVRYQVTSTDASIPGA
mmetsp:Transcript_3190/g.19726  ORF Transcript_3190/g.19726 Transcript_3190/m.19726 type:complete len:146 (-) Transcript_3190:307-744(-)